MYIEHFFGGGYLYLISRHRCTSLEPLCCAVNPHLSPVNVFCTLLPPVSFSEDAAHMRSRCAGWCILDEASLSHLINAGNDEAQKDHSAEVPKNMLDKESMYTRASFCCLMFFLTDITEIICFFASSDTQNKQLFSWKRAKARFCKNGSAACDACCLQKPKSNHFSEAAQIAMDRNWWRINIKWAMSCIMALFKGNVAKDHSLQIVCNIHHQRWMDGKQQPPI